MSFLNKSFYRSSGQEYLKLLLLVIMISQYYLCHGPASALASTHKAWSWDVEWIDTLTKTPVAKGGGTLIKSTAIHQTGFAGHLHDLSVGKGEGFCRWNSGHFQQLLTPVVWLVLPLTSWVSAVLFQPFWHTGQSFSELLLGRNIRTNMSSFKESFYKLSGQDYLKPLLVVIMINQYYLCHGPASVLASTPIAWSRDEWDGWKHWQKHGC